MTPVPRITCEILPPFFHPRTWERGYYDATLVSKLACFLVFLCSKDSVYKESQLLQVSRLTCYRNHAVVRFFQSHEADVFLCILLHNVRANSWLARL